jgi:hypothetical protein
MERKLSEDSLRTVVFLPSVVVAPELGNGENGGGGHGSQQSRRRTSNLHPLVFGRSWEVNQSTWLGPSIGLGPSTSFLQICENLYRYVTYLSVFGLWYETI